MANKLNSNEQFTPNQRFNVQVTFACTPSPGSGNGNRLKPGRKAIETMLAKKQ